MFRKSILASTLSLLLLPGGASALGLGGIRPESALNQPFAAEIELVGADPEQLDAVKVVLAPEAEFAKRGTERQQYLTKLRFKPQVSPRGKTVVRVTSAEPIREPYMDFLVEVIWPKGRLVKGYTVLLDPPVTARRSAPPVEPPVAERPVTSAPAAKPKPASRPEPAPPAPPAVKPPRPSAVQPVSAGSATDFPLRYGPVKSGTGLWRAARKLAPPGATVAQTAMALYRNNQQAFVRGDINKLRQGEVLQIPTAAELFAMDAGTAERELRSALSGKRVTSKPLTDVTAAAREEDARLRIAGAARSPGGPAEGRPVPAEGQATPSIEQELLLVRETGESTRQETDELRARVRQLESSLADIQQLLTLRDAELARLQEAKGAAPSPAQPGAAGPIEGPRLAGGPQGVGESGVPGDTTGRLPEAVQDAGQATVEAPPSPIADVKPEPAPEVEPAGPPPVPPATPPEPAVVEAGRPLPAEGAAPGGPEAVDAAAASPQPSPQPPKEEVSSWMDSVPLVGDTLRAVPEPVLWSAAVGIPLLGVLGWLSVRRRRRIEESLSELTLPSSFTLPDEGTSVMAPASEITEGLEEAYSEEPVLRPSSASSYPELGGVAEEGEESDVVAEADIYIAYGRYRDAETLLKDAIARSPRRADLHYKLADVYAGSRNQAALAALVDEMELAGMDRQSPGQWSRLIALVKAGAEGAPGPIPGTQAGPAAAAAGLGLGGLGLGGSQPAGRHRADAADLHKEATLAISLGGVDSLSPGGGDSLLEEDIRPRDLELGFEDLDLGPTDVGGGRHPPGRDLYSAPRSAPMGDTELDLGELTIADLTPATEVDLADLGVITPTRLAPAGGQAKALSRSTSGPAGAPSRGFEEGPGLAPVLGLDTEPLVRPAESTAEESEETASAWREAVPPPPGPTWGGGGLEAPRLTLGPVDQDSGSSDLLSSQWQMEGGLWDEVATKLDLGRAYFEMNDRQAAEAILLEVAEEGSLEQQVEARELLAQLKPN